MEGILYNVICISFVLKRKSKSTNLTNSRHQMLALLYRGVLYVEVILYSKECNWYTRCCPLNEGVHYRECPLREATLCYY